MEDTNNDIAVSKGAVFKCTGNLEDIFINTDLMRQNRAVNPHTPCTEMNRNQYDKQEDRTLDPQSMEISGNKNVTDGRQRE